MNHEVKNEATRELLDHVKGLIVDFAKVIKGINDATKILNHWEKQWISLQNKLGICLRVPKT